MTTPPQSTALEAWHRVSMHIQKIGGFSGWAQSTEDMVLIRAALQPTAPVRDDSQSSPLLRRYTDDQGHKMIAVAAWAYDDMVNCLDELTQEQPEAVGLTREQLNAAQAVSGLERNVIKDIHAAIMATRPLANGMIKGQEKPKHGGTHVFNGKLYSRRKLEQENNAMRTEILALVNGDPDRLKCHTFLGKSFQYWIRLEENSKTWRTVLNASPKALQEKITVSIENQPCADMSKCRGVKGALATIKKIWGIE